MKKSLVGTKSDPVTVYFLTLASKDTIDSYKYRLRLFCKFAFGQTEFELCDWSKLEYTTVLSFINHEREQNKAYSTVNVTLSAIKGVALHAWQLEFIDIEKYIKIKSIRKQRGQRLPAGRALEEIEIQALIKHFKRPETAIEARDYAIFALGCGAGLRRKELSLLNIEDIHDDKVIVNGKGNKTRTVFLSNLSQKALKTWLDVYQKSYGALFVRVYPKKGFGTRLSVLSIHRSIERVVKISGSEPFTSHDLRRTFATTLLDYDADQFSVKRLMGHASLNTTVIYDRRGEKVDKQSIKLLPF